MTTSITANPRMVTVTVHNTTPQSLLTLLRAIDSGAPRVACFLQLQAAIANMDKLIFVGNSDLNTTTRFGSQIQAGQALPVMAFDSNLIALDNVYVATDGTDTLLNVIYLTR